MMNQQNFWYFKPQHNQGNSSSYQKQTIKQQSQFSVYLQYTIDTDMQNVLGVCMDYLALQETQPDNHELLSVFKNRMISQLNLSNTIHLDLQENAQQIGSKEYKSIKEDAKNRFAAVFQTLSNFFRKPQNSEALQMLQDHLSYNLASNTRQKQSELEEKGVKYQSGEKVVQQLITAMQYQDQQYTNLQNQKSNRSVSQQDLQSKAEQRFSQAKEKIRNSGVFKQQFVKIEGQPKGFEKTQEKELQNQCPVHFEVQYQISQNEGNCQLCQCNKEFDFDQFLESVEKFRLSEIERLKSFQESKQTMLKKEKQILMENKRMIVDALDTFINDIEKQLQNIINECQRELSQLKMPIQTLSCSELQKYANEIKKYKPMHTQITQMQNQLLKDYENLFASSNIFHVLKNLIQEKEQYIDLNKQTKENIVEAVQLVLRYALSIIIPKDNKQQIQNPLQTFDLSVKDQISQQFQILEGQFKSQFMKQFCKDVANQRVVAYQYRQEYGIEEDIAVLRRLSN